MSRKELKNVLAFVKSNGSCYETTVCKAFVRNDTPEENQRVINALHHLCMKGLIDHKLNEEAESIVIDNNINYGS
jgi:hypothetical protein